MSFMEVVLAPPPTPAAAGSLYLPGVSGEGITCPHAVGLAITGDIDVRAAFIVPDVTPAASIMLGAKYVAAGNQVSWRFLLRTDGTLRGSWSPDGTSAAVLSHTSTAAVSTQGVTASTAWAYRWAFDVNVSGISKTSQFFVKATTRDTAKADCLANTGWSQVGTDVNDVTATSIFNATSAPLEWGSNENKTLLLLTGNFLAGVVMQGIAGTAKSTLDCAHTGARQNRLVPTSVTDVEGNVYSITGTNWKWAA